MLGFSALIFVFAGLLLWLLFLFAELIYHCCYNEYFKYLCCLLYHVLHILHMKFLVKLDFGLILICKHM